MWRSARKLGLLGSLYFSQGLPFGFFTQALPALMRERGHSLEAIGFANLLALPWALKFLWAPLVDRTGRGRFGRRKTWILPLQALAALALFALAFAEPTGGALGWLLVGVFVTNLLAATQDVPTDALAVALLEPSERGAGNGVQVAAYRVGMILGGSTMLWVLDRYGWRTPFLMMAALVVLASIPVWRYREPPVAPPVEKIDLRALRSFFRRDGAGAWVALLVVWKAGESFGTGILRPFVIDHGATKTDIAELFGGIGFTAGLAGALLGGLLLKPLGRTRALLVFGLFQAATVALWAYVAAYGDYPWLVGVTVVEHVASGTATAALFTWMMDACRPGTEGTDYTVQASAVVLAQGAASALSGVSAASLGYPGHFLLGAFVCLCAFVFAWLALPKLQAFRTAGVTERLKPAIEGPL